MAKLILKDVKIIFPIKFNNVYTDSHFKEWLEYELGVKADISLSNPLHVIELKDCNISIKHAHINGKELTLK